MAIATAKQMIQCPGKAQIIAGATQTAQDSNTATTERVVGRQGQSIACALMPFCPLTPVSVRNDKRFWATCSFLGMLLDMLVNIGLKDRVHACLVPPAI